MNRSANQARFPPKTRSEPERRSSATRRVLVALALVTVVVGVAAIVAAPRLVRAKIAEEALARGVIVTAGDLTLRWGSLTLYEVDAALVGAPLKAHVATVNITLDGLSPTDVLLDRLSVTVDGPLTLVHGALGAAEKKESELGNAKASTLQHVRAHDAHLRWTNALGPGVALDAAGAELDATFTPPAVAVATATLDAPKVSVESAGRAIGALRVSSKSTPSGLIVTIADLDPAGHAHATWSRGARGEILDLAIEKAKLSRYGFASLVPGQDPEVSATLHATNGAIDTGAFTYGVFRGALTGTVALDVPSVHLAYRTEPVSCAALAQQLASQMGGQVGGVLAGQLDALARAAGLPVVVGDVRATGEIVLDARDPKGARVTFVPSQACDLNFLR